MSNVTRLPPSGKRVHVEADIPASQLDEFNRTVTALIAGERLDTELANACLDYLNYARLGELLPRDP